jgi:hypothetical protein
MLHERAACFSGNAVCAGSRGATGLHSAWQVVTMSVYSAQQVSAFFASIEDWRPAYHRARLHFVAIDSGSQLSIIAARLFLLAMGDELPNRSFRAGHIVAGELEISPGTQGLEAILGALMSAEGFAVDNVGALRLPTDERTEVFVSTPALLHPEGLDAGNRLAVLSIYGSNWSPLLPQPQTDWLLKAAEVPYDTFQELVQDFGLGTLRQERTLVEVVARHALEVLARSEVSGTCATVGLWMSKRLDRDKARFGYRVLNKGKVFQRGAVHGSQLTWQEEGSAYVGVTQLAVPDGAVVHCIASYAGHAHHQAWRADPATYLNPRAAVVNLVDPNLAILRSYLTPDLNAPSRSRADDFESAVTWLLWTLGFSTVAFGTNAKTRDAFDVVAAAPAGDFLVVECTTGMLRADGKLSKLIARAATLRESLREASHSHLRVLAVAITALREEQVAADLGAAEEAGVLVLTRENLVRALDQIALYPDADAMFQRGIEATTDKQRKRKAALTGATEADPPDFSIEARA